MITYSDNQIKHSRRPYQIHQRYMQHSKSDGLLLQHSVIVQVYIYVILSNCAEGQAKWLYETLYVVSFSRLFASLIVRFLTRSYAV